MEKSTRAALFELHIPLHELEIHLIMEMRSKVDHLILRKLEELDRLKAYEFMDRKKVILDLDLLFLANEFIDRALTHKSEAAIKEAQKKEFAREVVQILSNWGRE
jgi:hypothetical protein